MAATVTATVSDVDGVMVTSRLTAANVNAASLAMKIVDRDDEPLIGTNKRFLSDIFDIESDDEPSTVSVRIPRRLRGDYDGVLIELVSDGWRVQCIEGEQQTDTGLKYLGRARKVKE
jgi:hypothetical protein